MVEEQKKYKYRAFISYSHKDEKFGNWLHKQLENYKIPKQLKKNYPHLPKKLFPIFRDIYELSAGDDLKVEIEKALKNSEALIILCSPKSAKSIWVNKEIIDFKKLHKDAKIIPIIIEGVPFAKESDNLDDELECFPDALKYEIDSDGNFTDEEIEIVASNAISKSEGRELAKLKLISGLLGVPFLDLYRRDEEQKKRTRRIQWSIGSLVFLMMLGLTVFSFQQKVKAEKNKKEAEKQLIIATNKTQSLSILTTKTIESLILTDEKVLEKYLKSIFNSGEREVFIEMLRPLIEKTESMDNDERQYWLDILPSMNEKQISKLVKILMVESQKLYRLGLKYRKEIKELNKKYLKKMEERLEKECFKDNKKQTCLVAINKLLDSSLENNESIITYFKQYKKLEKKPSAYSYYLYGKFLKNINNKKQSLIYLNKAISLDSNNSNYIKELAIYYKEEKNITKAMELANKAVFYRENELLRLKNIQKIKDVEKNLMKDIQLVLSLHYKGRSINEIIKIYKKFEKRIDSMKNKEPSIYLNIESYLSSSYADSKEYNKAIEHLKKIIDTYSQHSNKISNSWVAGKYMTLSWYQLFVGQYKEAINNSKKGIGLDKDKKMFLETNLAHAYLLSGDFESAKIIYMKNENKKFKDGRLWEDVILKDFKALKKEGVESNDFKKIEKLFYGENPMVIKFKDNKFYFYYKKSKKLCFSSVISTPLPLV